MRLVMLTRDGHEHRYVSNRLSRRVDLRGIIVERGIDQTRRQRLSTLRRRYTPGQAASRVIMKVLTTVRRDAKTRAQELERVLGAQSEFVASDRVIPVAGINSDAARRAILGLDPDVILVYGTSIVRDEILSLASQIALNMHTGISPQYTGTDCAFWPLVNRELDMLGATVHECTSEVDGGQIFASGRIDVDESDSRGSVFAKTVAVGAELYVRVVEELAEGRLTGRPQDPELRREYRSVDRTWRHEWDVHRAIRRGLFSGAQQPTSPS